MAVQIIAGVDEVGRGPLAGPVVACAVVGNNFPRMKDSKQLTALQREEIYGQLKKNPNVQWGIGRVSEKVIDKINIFAATKLAMVRAVKNLKLQADFLIIDGNFPIPIEIAQKSLVRADNYILECMAASIIAKVTRDKLMQRYHKLYPQYGFDKHKGYGTKSHLAMLLIHGLSPIHRLSFRPIRGLI